MWVRIFHFVCLARRRRWVVMMRVRFVRVMTMMVVMGFRFWL